MKKILIVFCLFFLTGCETDVPIIIEPPHLEDSQEIIIELKGAVKFPGLYTITKGTMLYELINDAGGLLDSADQEKINLVQIFNASCSVNLPYKNGNTPSSQLVNINNASLEELQTLKGIGFSKAQEIINYRMNTPFTSIEDIKKVSGIGEQVFLQIKDDITV